MNNNNDDNSKLNMVIILEKIYANVYAAFVKYTTEDNTLQLAVK